jgi:probable phosphoglycerate mutase
MKLYLIRHGDPDYENDTLTDRGHDEARVLPAYLASERVHEIVSSPLGRARDTARYTAEALGLPVRIEPWMAELRLMAETEDRRAAWDVHGHAIRNRDYLADLAAFERIPGIPADALRELLGELRSNSDRFLASLGYVRDGGAYRAEEPNDRRIAVFAHGGFGLTWLSLLLEIPTPLVWSGFFLHTSSVTQILFDERGDGLATPRCLMISALPHLFASELTPSTAGIKANYT